MSLVCRLPSAEKNLLKDLLVNVVANALYYNPALALQELQQQSRLTTFFSTWFQARWRSHAAVSAVAVNSSSFVWEDGCMVGQWH